jgi:flagellar biosynthesis/type III secretory pathway protein FliH
MKTEKIKFEAVSAKVESYGGAVQVTTEVEPSAVLGLFTWADIREFFEEQIEDEIIEATNKAEEAAFNKAYKEGYEEGKEFYSDYADYVAHKRDVMYSRD